MRHPDTHGGPVKTGTTPPQPPAEGMGDLAPAQNESLLRSAPERYAELVRNVAEFGIYLLDRNGRVQSWNSGASNITGYVASEIVGRPFSDLFAEGALRDSAPLKTLNFARENGHCRDEHMRRKKNGEEFFALCTLDAVRADNGEILGFVEVFHDISQQKSREDKLYRQATRDALTGVYNRGHFTEMATQEIERARRFSEPLSVVMMDIDHFKNVNDTYGHDVGDKTIIALARTTAEFLRKIDFVGRIGGEEFAVVLPRANKEPAFEMAQRLRVLLGAQKIQAPGKEFGFTTSMGVASLRSQTKDLAELLRNADAALYKAKREGRNRVECWFE